MSVKPVKHFHSAMAGAPVLNGQPGSLINMLDACLVNGFNLMTLDSLQISNGVLTGIKIGHGFIINQVVLIAGANQPALNGEWTVTTTTSGTFSADAAGVSDVVGNGTITAKAAPAGWQKAYSSINVAVYKSLNPSSTGAYLRVDDTGTNTARVRGYMGMTDINTGTDPFPSEIQVNGGAYFGKCINGGVLTVPMLWAIFASDSAFFIHNRIAGDDNYDVIAGFFDFSSEKSGDAYKCGLSAFNSSSAFSGATSSHLASVLTNLSSYSSTWCPRSFSQIGSSVLLKFSSNLLGGTSSGTNSNFMYPSPVSNGLIISPVAIIESSVNVLRSKKIPGIYHTPQYKPLTHLDVADNVDGLGGRKLMACSVSSNNIGRVFFDITGPWE